MSKNYLKKLIIVNAITGIRAIGSIFLILIYNIWGLLGLGISIGIFYITDALDGYLARKLEVSTFFGAIFDGMSDKLFDIITLILLSINNHFLLIPLIIEILILLVGYNTAFKGNKIKSLKIGKIKTFIMACSFVLITFLSLYDQTNVIINIIIVIAIIFDLLTLLSYILVDKKDTKKNQLYQTEIAHKQGLKSFIVSRINLLKKINQNSISKEEIHHKLFDHKFYIENKNKPIKNLLMKNNKSL
jgi:phosphatidylglycerophosphate synthase